MRQRVHVITLGVDALQRSSEFYQELGWRPASNSNASIVFFDLGALVLGLFPRAELAADAAVDSAGEGFRGVTLAHNVASQEDVDATISHAVRSGGRQVKTAARKPWGGYSGYVADPDDHLWEVAFNPFFAIDASGYIALSTGSD